MPAIVRVRNDDEFPISIRFMEGGMETVFTIKAAEDLCKKLDEKIKEINAMQEKVLR